MNALSNVVLPLLYCYGPAKRPLRSGRVHIKSIQILWDLDSILIGSLKETYRKEFFLNDREKTWGNLPKKQL